LELYQSNSYQTQEEYKTLFEQAPDAVIAIDELSNVIFWNPKAEEIFGWSVEETLGRPLSGIIIPEALREAHDTGMKRYLSTGEVRVLNRTIEVPAINKRGQEFIIALTIAKTNLKGRIAFLAFIRDVTEQHQSREALERKTQELKHSNRNLEEFAYAASHDLKEPIRKIHFFSDSLKQSLGDRMTEAERRNFDRIASAATRMSSLIEDLLSYSQLSLKSQLVEQVDINQLIGVVLEDLDLEIEKKGATVLVEKLFTTKGHKRQLQQAIQNLVSNALKYSKPGIAPEIKISSEQVAGEETGIRLPDGVNQKNYHLLSISDNGIGFEQGDAERIFDIFTRLHGLAEYKGNGIGLAITRKVIENHNGYIWAKSKPGEGATFYVLLPIV
jgi:PAS domain S-box-containing protein